MKRNQFPRTRAENGFSVVEMIVAMVIFMIIVGTIYGLLQVGLIDRNRASRRSDIMKNARSAVHLIGRDALNAGLSYNKNGAIVPDNFVANKLGLPADPNDQRDVLTSIVGGNNMFENILNPAARTDLIAFAYRDTNFNQGNIISLNDAAAAGGAPATVRLVTTPNGAQNVKSFDLYLVESDSSQVAVMATGAPSANQIDIAPTDPLGLNQPLNGTGNGGSVLRKCEPPTLTENCSTYVATVKRFFWVAYKVKADGTLVRMVFGNNTGGGADRQIQEMPIAYNIEDLQIRYVLEDGTTTENPGAGPDGVAGTDDDTPARFNLVRQINVSLKVQATEADEQMGTPMSVTLNASFGTRNMEYDAG